MGRRGDLADYRSRRNFAKTREPEGEPAQGHGQRLAFYVQKHDATTLHFDLRLEWDGVLKSWAIAKGPSSDPGDKRLAVRTEDHPLDYGNFEGTIPAEDYGGGTVMLWDCGTWEPVDDPGAGLEEGKLHFRLTGERMTGGWVLVRMRGEGRRENWLLIKEDDAAAGGQADALTERYRDSIATGRDLEAIAETGDPPGRSDPPPAFRKPQLATLADAAPAGDEWVHETKFDGYRALAAVGRGGTRFYSRGGKDWTGKFAALAGAFDPLECESALIDGEVMAARARGSAFSALQAALSEGRALRFHAFDLLSLDGTDLAETPQDARRAVLERLFGPVDQRGPLRLSDQVRGDGPEVFAKACDAGAEGIVSKRLDAPYRGRRSRAWLKVKCSRRQEFVVGGLSPSDKAGRPFSSLLLGGYGPEGLVYRGRVGAGFGEADFDRITGAMTRRKTSPFVSVPSEMARGATWLRPELVAEIEFTELTADGHVRHGVFLGLRDDKEAGEVGMETPEEDNQKAEAAGVEISHPGRVLFPKQGVTKLDLARYYRAAGGRMVEIGGHRPLALLRCPEGVEAECFFQKHPQGFPEALQRVSIEESDGETAEHLYVTRTEAVVAAAQMGTIEFHIWGARVDRLGRPDRMVLDLDPGEGVRWEAVRDAAFETRDLLAELGLASGAMVTGGKGVHVCVALRRTTGWETLKLFAQGVAELLAARAPDRFTATMSKAKRKGRIFVDYLRNERGATAIAPYSVRARPGAPVAMPVSWEDLGGLAGADVFRLGDISGRLDAPCPYLALQADLQSLTRSTVARIEARYRGG